MKRGSLRRNAFALGKEGGESSEPSHDLDEVFGMPSTSESVDLEADEDNRPCTQLTHEQITGKIVENQKKYNLNFRLLAVSLFSEG